MLGWFCGGCHEDQEGSVWDGWDKETGKCLCKKCKVEPHNAGPEHYCPQCKGEPDAVQPNVEE